jgi:ketosteroid isomerase-like protein
MRRFAFFAAVAVIAAGFLFWWFSPGQVVKRRTKNLIDLANLEAGTGTASRALGTFTLTKLLDDPVALSVPSVEEANGRFARQELEAGYQWFCRSAKESRVKVTGFDEISVVGDEATVRATLDAQVVFPTYRPSDGPVQATSEWRKRDDGWRLVRLVWENAP